MYARAKSNFSINRPISEDKDGINPLRYSRGYVYDITRQLYDDNREHFQGLDAELKDFSRGELLVLARRAGVEEPQDMDKPGLAEAIQETQGPKRGLSLSDLTRKELNERAKALGIPDPEDMQNKAKVIEAIRNA